MYATFFSTLALVAGSAAGRGALAGLVADHLRSYLRGKREA